MDDFKTKFKYLRTERGLSQNDIAVILNTTQDTISLWELGKRYPDCERLIKIAKYFDVSADYLLGLSDNA